MAKALWPNEDAIGKCIKVNADTVPCSTVVGVTEEIRTGSIEEDPRTFHYIVSLAQFEPDNVRGGLFIRTRGDAAHQTETIRRELQRLMPGDSYLQVRPMSDVLAPVMRSWQLGATLFVAFGGLALVLATIGLYSVIAYNVVQRTHELGVRVALGAKGKDVLGLVLGQGVRLAATGIVLGTLVALLAGRLVKPLLFNVSPRDPIVFALVALSLLGAAVLASVLPSLRASRVDPITALRSD
jgi:ABC-type antimicrobial peptide transport system permease subunit